MPTSSHDADIEAFVRSFNDDPVKAVLAIRSYAERTRNLRGAKKPAPQPTGPVLVEVRDATKTYKVGRQHIRALQGVSVHIREGEFVAITGASGSGKSTLLQLIGGLDKPTGGDIIVGGTSLSKLSDSKLSRFRGQTIGFVFQFFYLQPFLRLERNLEVPGMFARAKRPDRTTRVHALSDAVGLTDRLAHLPKELSGGQMQRAAIARALVNKPKIILADEPTGNLDSTNSAAIIELFEQIRREFGTTIVIVTHDQAIARRADREIILRDGRLV